MSLVKVIQVVKCQNFPLLTPAYISVTGFSKDIVLFNRPKIISETYSLILANR